MSLQSLRDEEFYELVDKTAAVMADELIEKWLGKCQLVFQTSHTWRPLNKPFATDVPVFHLLGRLIQPRRRESHFVKRLTALALAFEHFDKTFCTDYDYDNGVMEDHLTNRYACESLRNRWAMLGSHAVNFDARIKLKADDFAPPKEPKILSVHPGIGWQGAETFVTIHGENFGKKAEDKHGKPVFENWVMRVFIGGVECTSLVTDPNTVVAKVPAGKFSRAKLKHDVTVVTSEGTATVRGAIEFVRRTKRSTGTPVVTVTRDAEGRVTAISVNPDAIEEKKDGDLLQSIRAILEKEKCCEKVKSKVKKPK